MNVPVIIPTYNPSARLIEVIKNLTGAGFSHIIVIDDGSRPDCAPVFDEAAALPGCTLLRHDKNRGKGRGLKTGFLYVIENMPDCDGVVTTDDDGQHSPGDILRCAEKMTETGKIILGARDFSGGNVPPKSRFGNNATRIVFRVLCGIKITDTQTGLRAVPLQYLQSMTGISGERFEYETNMLLEMKRLSMPYAEEKIETIYSDNNSGTHFNPFTDSIKIYAVILKFAISSLSCFLIDMGLFTLLNMLLIPAFGENESGRLFAATAGARAVSSLVNYFLNRNRVFRSKQSIKTSICRYYILCVVQLSISYALVWGLSVLLGTEKSMLQSVLKLVVDTLLFFASFGIQRDWVYSEGKKTKEKAG